MGNVPKRVAARIAPALKQYQKVLEAAKDRDVGEADTVTIVKDMLADMFGYDKYTDLTSEYAIRGTYCDLGIKVDGSLQTLIEVKAIGLDLKDQHVKQAVDYAANQGVDWVLLTNGICWRVYRVIFAKPIANNLVVDLDLCSLNPRSKADIELLYLWCKEAWQKSVLSDYNTQKEALSRHMIAAAIRAPAVLGAIRRELRRVSPDVRIQVEQIESALVAEVLKRDVIEGDDAKTAQRRIRADRRVRAESKKAEDVQVPATGA